MRKFGTGDGGLAMHRPGFRVTDVPPSDELQRAREAYEHELTTAWERGTGKEGTVSDAPRVSGNVAMPVRDIEKRVSALLRGNFTGIKDTAMRAASALTSEKHRIRSCDDSASSRQSARI